MSETPVRIERRDAICEITLDRPKANAMDAATSRALGAAFQAFQEDAALRVAIITGGGERFFSAGWDLKAAAAGEAASADQGVGGFAGLTEFFSLDKPVIAAVNGMAMGGGFELALAADLIVAAEHAEFALPEVKIGIIPDGGGALRLPKRMPRALAMELMLTGRRVGAAELARWGVINRVAPSDALMSETRALAEEIAANAPLALRAVKEVVGATEALSEEAGYAEMRSGRLKVYSAIETSEDAAEGVASFAEKRAPRWRGR